MQLDHLIYQYTHPSWHECLLQAVMTINHDYRAQLSIMQNWLPGPAAIFTAFTVPLPEVRYVLLGESPYPRAASANGYAFWDADVELLWSATGLSTKVNRATSLRHLMKMLLIAAGLLVPPHYGQADIARLNKQHLVSTAAELFTNFLRQKFLLLNAALVFRPGRSSADDAKFWRNFLITVLQHLAHQGLVTLVLFGRVARQVLAAAPVLDALPRICAEHPYNQSFITNPQVIEFFAPLHLLRL